MRLVLALNLLALAARAAEPPAIAVTGFQSGAADADKAKGLSGARGVRYLVHGGSTASAGARC